jgi:hypothetical protein
MGIDTLATECIKYGCTALQRNLALGRASAHENSDFSKTILIHHRISPTEMLVARFEFSVIMMPFR